MQKGEATGMLVVKLDASGVRIEIMNNRRAKEE
jgi:hypothetical protein